MRPGARFFAAAIAVFTVGGSTAWAADPELVGPRARPAFELALAAGVSFDRTGIAGDKTSRIPLFYVMGGFGDGLFGLDLAVMSTSALGRYSAPSQPIDRIVVEGVALVRPGVAIVGDRIDYGARVARTLAVGGGPAYEHLSAGRVTGTRRGVRFSLHLDLPLGPRTRAGSFAVRLGVRKLIGFGRVPVQMVSVGDSIIEAFGGLAVVF